MNSPEMGILSDNEAEKILKEFVRNVEKIDPSHFLNVLLRTHFKMPVHELPVEEDKDDGSFRVLQDDLKACFRAYTPKKWSN